MVRTIKNGYGISNTYTGEEADVTKYSYYGK